VEHSQEQEQELRWARMKKTKKRGKLPDPWVHKDSALLAKHAGAAWRTANTAKPRPQRRYARTCTSHSSNELRRSQPPDHHQLIPSSNKTTAASQQMHEEFENNT